MKVACAVIYFGDKILIVQRSATMALPLKWEFPGGKLEPGESARDCIKREIKEELAIEIELLGTLKNVSFQYPKQLIILLPFLARYKTGTLALKEHQNWKLVPETALLGFDFAPADLLLIEELLNHKDGTRNL